jgi:hypothetical protein
LKLFAHEGKETASISPKLLQRARKGQQKETKCESLT